MSADQLQQQELVHHLNLLPDLALEVTPPFAVAHVVVAVVVALALVVVEVECLRKRRKELICLA